MTRGIRIRPSRVNTALPFEPSVATTTSVNFRRPSVDVTRANRFAFAISASLPKKYVDCRNKSRKIRGVYT